MQKKMRTFCPKIKICGLTNLDQALACVELGADWLGFNCWHGSPRYVNPSKIFEIISHLPKTVTTVGVFVNERPFSVDKIMDRTGLDVAQLHGDETPEYIKKIKSSWIKAFRFKPEFKTEDVKFFGQETFLLDAYSKNNYGGSGKTLDWNEASKFSRLGKLILAGGLNPENISEAVNKVNPWGVDVCSGVEKEPGIKDMKKVSDFVKSVNKVVKLK